MANKRLRKPNGYWNDETIINELKPIIDDIGHFPTHTELNSMGKSGLAIQIHMYGGTDKFREILGYVVDRKPRDYWSEVAIIEKLKLLITELGYFPTHHELKTIEVGMSAAITRNGGIYKFREILGYPMGKRINGYWTEETVCSELEPIINRMGHFPTHYELNKMGLCDLVGAMVKCGGGNKFRNLLNYPVEHHEHGYWTEEKIIEELKEIIKLIGHFPTQRELTNLGRSDINSAIARQHKNINTYRSTLDIPITRQKYGYWTDENIIKELKQITDKIGHFPSINELEDNGNNSLVYAVTRHGGYNKIRKLSGYPTSLYEQYRSESASYTFRRGRHTENFVKRIIIDWANRHDLPEPKYNIKLSKGNIIEFVCGSEKPIGIDITNTATRYAVSRKWTHKDYHNHLDELWIVVFSDSFTEDDYIKWNQESPENVKVFSIYKFLDELDYSLDEYTKNKIDRYCKCTFRSKEELTIKDKQLHTDTEGGITT